MHLIMLVHATEDLPIRFFIQTDREAERQAAIRYARQVQPMPTEKIYKVLGTDCSTPLCVKIVEFHGGVPIHSEVIKTFDVNRLNR